jgi:signal transduction histidine kinase
VAVRNLAYDLRPPGLEKRGLASTIFQYCQDFSDKHGVRVDFHATGLDGLKLDSDTEINLYRLVQEALNNVKKHANAKHVTVAMIASSPNIVLRIEDDGRGFDVNDRLASAVEEKRLGLRSMEERVGLLEGEMRIQSRAMEGTRIFIEVPNKGKKHVAKQKYTDN